MLTTRRTLTASLMSSFFLLLVAACNSEESNQPAPSLTKTPPAATDQEAGPEHVIGVPLAGCAPYYLAPTRIGSQTFHLAIDTGSTTTAVVAAGCEQCSLDGAATLYEPGPGAVATEKQSSAKYGSGGTWSGEIFTDEFVIGDGASGRAVSVSFAAIREQNLIVNDSCGTTMEGILGLGVTGRAHPGTTSFLDQVAASGRPDVFAVELCAKGGHLWLGGYDPAFVEGSPVYTPMAAETAGMPAYNVTIADVQVAGASIDLPSSALGPSIVDTGGQYFHLPSAVFAALASRIGDDPGFRKIFGDGSWFTTARGKCTVLAESAEQLDASLPTLTLALGSDGDVSLELRPSTSYLMPFAYRGQTYWCPGIADAKSFGRFILGGGFLRNMVTIFDRAERRIGFVRPKSCE